MVNVQIPNVIAYELDEAKTILQKNGYIVIHRLTGSNHETIRKGKARVVKQTEGPENQVFLVVAIVNDWEFLSKGGGIYGI